MARELSVRVYYPVSSGRIVLRTELDWDRSIEADGVSQGGTCHEFHVPTDDPFFYFKPGLQDGSSFYWAQGMNYLALASERDGKDVYPVFFSERGGMISEDLGMGGLLSMDFPTHHFRIYHPPGYFENRLQRYPVLYMHDGQNLFFPREAFLGQHWKVDETMGLLDAMNVIEPVIVVGIYPKDRMVEYTQPGYENYGKYILQLKDGIDRAMRTLKGPATTAVMGSSLGGVVSMYLAWEWPHVFGKAACMSSTFTWQDDLMQRIESEPRRNIKVYLDSGWPGDNYEVTLGMRDLLLSRGYAFGQDLLYFAFPNARHHESDWATRSHIPFQFFFGQHPYPKIPASLPL